jgi:hypothetical protein
MCPICFGMRCAADPASGFYARYVDGAKVLILGLTGDRLDIAPEVLTSLRASRGAITFHTPAKVRGRRMSSGAKPRAKATIGEAEMLVVVGEALIQVERAHHTEALKRSAMALHTAMEALGWRDELISEFSRYHRERSKLMTLPAARKGEDVLAAVRRILLESGHSPASVVRATSQDELSVSSLDLLEDPRTTQRRAKRYRTEAKARLVALRFAREVYARRLGGANPRSARATYSRRVLPRLDEEIQRLSTIHANLDSRRKKLRRNK